MVLRQEGVYTFSVLSQEQSTTWRDKNRSNCISSTLLSRADDDDYGKQ